MSFGMYDDIVNWKFFVEKLKNESKISKIKNWEKKKKMGFTPLEPGTCSSHENS